MRCTLKLTSRRSEGILCLVLLVLSCVTNRSQSLSAPPHRPRILSKRPLDEFLSVERSILQKRDRQFTHIIGSDDSGGGAIAGPIVCCSVCITQDLKAYQPLVDVNDSKVVSAAKREEIFEHITQHPEIYSFALSICDNTQIDASSVLDATMSAFRETIQAVATSVINSSTTDPQKLSAFYSIIDGHRSPSHLSLSSRPYKNGDAIVYTVALASILARVTRDRIVKEYVTLYPNYGFEKHGGYASRAHTQAIHTHGPLPVHRVTTKPFKGRVQSSLSSSSRREFGFLAAAALTSTLVANIQPAAATTNDPKTGIALPDPGEIEAAVPTDWTIIDNPFDDDTLKTKFNRLDSSPDSLFYTSPRFVEHVDDQAVKILNEYVSKTVDGTSAVLDMCTSWTSHIVSSQVRSMPTRVAGLGMNQNELDANTVLTERVIQDLNEKPVLPYATDSFDIVLCQLSIDYLTKPLQICQEIARVLKPGGSVHILFSNRLFLQKAVGIWTGADDIDHCFTVASYLHFCHTGGFDNIRAVDLSVRNRSKRIVGDPMYVVTASKSQ